MQGRGLDREALERQELLKKDKDADFRDHARKTVTKILLNDISEYTPEHAADPTLIVNAR